MSVNCLDKLGTGITASKYARIVWINWSKWLLLGVLVCLFNFFSGQKGFLFVWELWRGGRDYCLTKEKRLIYVETEQNYNPGQNSSQWQIWWLQLCYIRCTVTDYILRILKFLGCKKIRYSNLLYLENGYQRKYCYTFQLTLITQTATGTRTFFPFVPSVVKYFL